MNIGTVKRFNEPKGFGFRSPECESADVFVHFGEIGGDGFKTLTEGQTVNDQVENSSKGLPTTQVQPQG